MTFNTLDELKNNKEMQRLGKYDHKKVLVDGKVCVACGTCLAYEDEVWGNSYNTLSYLNDAFELELDEDNMVDMSSEIRDYVLKLLEEKGITFIDIQDEF